MRWGFAIALVSAAASAAPNPDSGWQEIPVSVSAANYSQLSREELFERVNAPPEDRPDIAAPPAPPDRPIFYGFVAGEVYPTDVSVEHVRQVIGTALARRGWFDAVYEAQSGRLPSRIDYLIRVNFGVRRWKTATVRTDLVTWGDAGVSTSWSDPRSIYRIGPPSRIDSRAGQDPTEVMDAHDFIQSHSKPGTTASEAFRPEDYSDHGATRDYALVVVEAFRLADVSKLKKAAPCAWATFVAVPVHPGQSFSSVLAAMAKAATPYFAGTTTGIQDFKIPAGKVLIGQPVEVSDTPKGGH